MRRIQSPIYLRQVCALFLLFVSQSKTNARCISESYAGQCEDADPECAIACGRDNMNSGKCEPYKSTRLCYCEECPDATGLHPAVYFGADKNDTTATHSKLEEALRRSQDQKLRPFLFRELLFSECVDLATTNCKIRMDDAYSINCAVNKSFRAFCTSKAEDFEAGYFLQKIGQLNASRILLLSLGGKRSLTKQLFRPVEDILVDLAIFNFPQLQISLFASASIKLPVLMSLQIFNCQSITIQRGDFLPFPSLRQVLFTAKTTIASIEENAFESITHLQHIIFEQGFDTSNALPAELKTQLSLIHCGREYKWLRDWLLLRPFLITPKKFGEVYTIAHISSLAMSRKDIFIPVDCASISLISNKSDGLFSSLMDG